MQQIYCQKVNILLFIKNYNIPEALGAFSGAYGIFYPWSYTCITGYHISYDDGEGKTI